jgi:hypothetical protein
MAFFSNNYNLESAWVENCRLFDFAFGERVSTVLGGISEIVCEKKSALIPCLAGRQVLLLFSLRRKVGRKH